ncbi:hypothetical protein ACFOJ6_10830 [Gordonia humi]|uniref:hypothetical protein n=1 Tax=Gordonia humi TaxID=686429 RepID=UPI003619EDA3
MTVAATQLPFMVAGYDGWKAALDFQGRRQADATTNGIWYWGLRYLLDGDTPAYRSAVDIGSPLLIVAGISLALWIGVRRLRRDGTYPWLQVAAAMLAVFMLFHKVHSPQYTLWILPFFVMLTVRWQLIAVYLIADVAMDLSVFRFLGMAHSADRDAAWSIWVVGATSWIHVVCLAVFVVMFARARIREPLASYLASTGAPSGPLTRLALADAARSPAAAETGCSSSQTT